MKYLLFIVILVVITSCKKEETEKSFFNSDKLEELHIENLTEFFGIGELSTYASPFKSYIGYVDGVGYENNNKAIFVSVFESKEKAIECMQGRIKTVSGIIEAGTTNILEQNWWYSEAPPKAIFKNQWNAIIEVTSNKGSFEENKDIFVQAIKELTSRVKNLGE